jgi:protein phosphatase
VAIVFNLPEKICTARNRERPDRTFGPHVVGQQCAQLRRSLRRLKREGFRHVFILNSPEEVDAATVERRPMWTDLRGEHGPFDIIGDVHGCLDELLDLLRELGYEVAAPAESESARWEVRHPDRRKLVFLGDLVDRGPRIADVLRLAIDTVEAGTALCVPGNHDTKLLRKLRGKNVQMTYGLAESVAQLEAESPEFREKVVGFIDGRVSHYVLDGGNLVVAHAGMRAEMQGRGSARVREFALYGDTTGESNEFGLPIRYPWAEEYCGRAMVVYGHTPVPNAEWLNRTINIDTGCVFGGKLTALRYPERELVSVPAARTHCEPAKPFLSEEEQAPALSAQQRHDELLDIAGVLGKRIIPTGLHRNVTVREENAAAALEVISRFCANPKWVIYLPPTMSPCETARESGLLEHPAEAFAYYRNQGIPRVVCQEKHMGSRAIVIVCRDEDAARGRFGIADGEPGICYTRTGRRFSQDQAFERAMLDRLRAALTAAGIWEEFRTDWVCLDCELMPWSVKAQELLRSQYAAVGAAARAGLREVVGALVSVAEPTPEVALREVVGALVSVAEPTPEVAEMVERHRTRADMADGFVQAYRQYCWPVDSLADLKLAPFHFLATATGVHTNRDHLWHMETLGHICHGDDQLLLATPYRLVDVTDPTSQEEGIRWWQQLTERGGEGMVVKPLEFVARGRRGLIQPALKCRGREYLRIIYGPEYTAAENIERLRKRGLSTKRSLALREFALGIEGLERFVRKEPLQRVHECVFGVLALESEPVDPRL